MRRLRKAKIVATLGPASSTKAAIEALFLAGADVFRFNFSHGSHQDHQARCDIVREMYTSGELAELLKEKGIATAAA